MPRTKSSLYCDACANEIGNYERFIPIEEQLDESENDVASERIANEKDTNSL